MTNPGNVQDWPFSQCLTNEYGECTQADGDTHDTLAGSKSDGTFAGSMAATCDDWTNRATGYGAAAFGHSWPRQLSGSDMTADWINTGEGGEACGAIINVTSTNYVGGGGGWSTPTVDDGGMPPGGMGDMGDMDGGFVLPVEIPDGGSTGVGSMGGESTEDSTYAGGVGSAGGYGGFYCFAYSSGSE